MERGNLRTSGTTEIQYCYIFGGKTGRGAGVTYTKLFDIYPVQLEVTETL